MCQSLWEKKSDEDEFIEFFQKGIDTIAGQRHKIRQLDHGCDEAMNTCDSRTRTEHNPYGATLYREIEETQYRCKICGHQIWVAKLEGTIEWKK
jgi:phosphoenolpyruvate-protein kinase (PTS system EI component)